MNKKIFRVGDKVRIKEKGSNFYGFVGKIISQDDSMWQVEVYPGVGIYKCEYCLEKENG